MSEQLLEALRSENATLRERILQLEQQLVGSFLLPVEWRLTEKESRVMGALIQRDFLTKDQIMMALYSDRHSDEVPDLKIVDVFICKIRKKLAPFGIRISTRWGLGYELHPDDRGKLKSLAKEPA